MWELPVVALGVGWWGGIRQCFLGEDTSELNLKEGTRGMHISGPGATRFIREVNEGKFQGPFLNAPLQRPLPYTAESANF